MKSQLLFLDVKWIYESYSITEKNMDSLIKTWKKKLRLTAANIKGKSSILKW